MKISRRDALGLMAAAGTGMAAARSVAETGGNTMMPAGRVATSAERRLAPGNFAPGWESLKQHYRTPDWFRDAKFGIWAHWSAQCVPEQGDWYARRMYMQGNPAYDYHVKTYGHPSKVGFKEIDALWKVDAWQPERLMDLYQAAGAKYFMALGNHHDNFDTWNSRYNGWNATRLGPMRDIIGEWSAICRRRGLKMGVSIHAAHAWHWFQTAYGYDAEGPLKGVRYDGYTSRKSMGKGTAWQGLDPQELYVGQSLVVPDGMTSAKAMRAWHDENDGVWDENPPCMHPEFTNRWFLRTRDMMDTYRPDMVYFDDTELPLGQTGLDVTAHFLNSNAARNGGTQQAVVTGKQFVPQHRGAVTLDLERGRSEDILELPYQTDTCIGDWHYNVHVFEEHRYKTAKTVVHMLADIVSKNGNLCLNIPLKGDGSIDSDEREILAGLAAWIPANGEAIFGTRPFTVYGEGPPDPVATGNFNEGKGRPMTAEDIRFTTKDGPLYAIALGWPADGRVRMKTLGRNSAVLPVEVLKVESVVTGKAVPFHRTTDALELDVRGMARDEVGTSFRLTPASMPGR